MAMAAAAKMEERLIVAVAVLTCQEECQSQRSVGGERSDQRQRKSD